MTTPEDKRGAIREKVRKLLAQADSVAGTPEGEAFESRAFELLAEYGMSEVEARSGGQNHTREATMRIVVIDGPYPLQQRLLLCRIADALHCETVYVMAHANGLGYGRKVANVMVYGLEDHLHRVTLLHALLTPQMQRQAAAQSDPFGMVSTRKYRGDWMRGWSYRIRERLRAIEARAASATLSKAGELVLLSDAEKAIARRTEDWPSVPTARITKVDSRAYRGGKLAAESVDLGGSTLPGAWTAISA